MNWPPAAFVVNPARALPLDVLMIAEDGPSRMIVAAFVTTLAPVELELAGSRDEVGPAGQRCAGEVAEATRLVERARIDLDCSCVGQHIGEGCGSCAGGPLQHAGVVEHVPG